MRPLKAALLLSFSLSFMHSRAQITEIGSISNSYNILNIVASLSASPKLIGYRGTAALDTVYLFNMDQTVYRVMVRPAVPPGWSYDHACYVTESLFDNDPTTIEYLTVKHDPDYFYQWVMVIQKDGTVLFETANSASIYDQGSIGNVEHYQHPIYSSATQGTYMVLLEEDSLGAWSNHIYTLPGRLPCLSCDNLSMDSDNSGMGSSSANFNVFPNPTENDAVIRYTLPPGTHEATLVLFNMNGAEVKRWNVSGEDQGQVTVTGLAAGTYTYQLRNNSGSLGTQRSVVVR